MTVQPTVPVQSPISLEIPCRPEHVTLCRLVAGAIGARDGLPEDVVADVKVIVTEACNCLLALANGDPEHPGEGCSGGARPAGPDCSLRMEFDSRPDELAVGVLFPHARQLLTWLEACDPLSEAGLGFTILKALADEMTETDAGDEGTVLRLGKRLTAAC